MPKAKAKSENTEKKQRKSTKTNKQREITGIIFLALGLFLFTCMFLKSTGLLGGVIKSNMYGLFGLSAYTVPLLISGVGGALILMDRRKLNKGKVAVLLIFFICFMSLLHVFSIRLFETDSFAAFVASGYDVGLEIKGQGAFSAILTYPVWKLIGTVGSIIFYLSIILLLLVIFTNMSLKKVGEGVKEKFDDTKESIEKRREVRKQQRIEKERVANERRGQESSFGGFSFGKRNKLYTKPLISKDDELDDVDDIDDINIDIDTEEKGDIDVPEFINHDYSFLGNLKKDKDGGKLPVFDLKNHDEEEINEEDSTPKLSEEKYQKYFSSEQKPGSVFSAPLGGGTGQTKPDDLPGSMNISINDRSKYRPSYGSLAFGGGFLHLLKEPETGLKGQNRRELERKSRILEETLSSFNVSARVINITSGPTITRYELQPAHGVKINRILSLQDDIKMALAARDIRIEAPIPGKNAVGIEIPNDNIRTVYLKEVLQSNAFTSSRSKLTFALGIDIDGNSVVADLKKMPHLLVAGTTGSGKSVCVNNIILSFLYNASPDEIKMIMIDPKMVEMTAYNDLPHMLIPVVTDSNKAAGALRWALNEMEMRYKLFSKMGVKELATYNSRVGDDERKPAVVVFVDELADLMMVAKAEVEEIICRIAQKGRAAGIHLVLATQRPSVNVITGVIKANIPSRIAFHVTSQIDSRTILDSVGAERLLGRGDMLFHPNGAGSPKRLQGAFVSEEEIRDITDYIKESSEVEYSEEILNEIEKNTNAVMGLGNSEDAGYDELLPEAVKLVINLNEASTSLLQRKMRLGYARAARIIDEMEEMGIIGAQSGSKRREVLISFDEYERMFGEGSN